MLYWGLYYKVMRIGCDGVMDMGIVGRLIKDGGQVNG